MSTALADRESLETFRASLRKFVDREIIPNIDSWEAILSPATTHGKLSSCCTVGEQVIRRAGEDDDQGQASRLLFCN